MTHIQAQQTKTEITEIMLGLPESKPPLTLILEGKVLMSGENVIPEEEVSKDYMLKMFCHAAAYYGIEEMGKIGSDGKLIKKNGLV